MTLRILHVLDHSVPLQSGYSFRTLSLLREQRALGWETFQLTTPKQYGSTADEEDFSGFHFYRTRVPATFLRRAPVLGMVSVIADTARRLRSVAEQVRPDIIHAHSPCLNGLAALSVGHGLRLPVVYEMRASWEDAAVDHGTTAEGSLRYRLSRALETHVLKRADAITTICDGLVRDIMVRGIPQNRITVVPNAVDVAGFPLIEAPDLELRERLGLSPGPVVGFVGSFYGYEGLDLLLEALPQVLRAWPDTQVLLVGGGPAEPELRRRAGALGIDSKVKFAGRVPHEQVRRYYSLIDILAYPRRSMRLTELVTPLKPLEAMSLGRLFVASDVGGHRELIPEHLRNYSFRAGDSGDLARVLLALLEQRAGWAALIDAGRRYVTERCTWQLSAARYREVYAGVLRGREGGGSHVPAA